MQRERHGEIRPAPQHLTNHRGWIRGIECKRLREASGKIAGIVEVDLQIVRVSGNRALGSSIDQAPDLGALGLREIRWSQKLFHRAIVRFSLAVKEESERTVGVPPYIVRIQIADGVLDVLENLN